LTVSSDLLPTLSALAQQSQAAFNDTSLAGFWKGDLGRGLGWQLSWEPPAIGTRPEEYRAPTWCWSSIAGKVIYGTPSNQENSWEIDNKVNKHATPLRSSDAQCTLSGTNAFGEFRDGFLTLFATFTSAILEVPEVTEGADGALIPYRIWPELGKEITAQIQRPPVDYAWFRPDVPLIQSGSDMANGAVKNTVVRPTLKPGQSRKAISARVWVAYISDYSLVLCRPSRVSGAYEWIGILPRSHEFWSGIATVSTDKEITIV
jgi:hypothetical protein